LWRRATNTATFTDGWRHWALTEHGLIVWEGDAVDPPSSYAAPEPPPPTPPVVTIPTAYVLPLVGPPPDETAFPCLRLNPSCARDPWWVEWNEIQGRELVQFSFLPPGFVAEARFIEAIGLLWQWPEGQALLGQAADHGVIVVAADLQRSAFAAYQASTHLLAVNVAFAETSTWMVSDMLAHELRHVADQQAGIRMAATYADCIEREQGAYQTERRFLLWLAGRFGGLPSPGSVRARLTPADFALYSNLRSIATSPDVDARALEDYRQSCSRFR
jgi:hypothetical protein